MSNLAFRHVQNHLPKSTKRTPVTALQQTPAVDVVAIGYQTGDIVLHNLRTDEQLVAFQQKGPVTSLAFRTDGHDFFAVHAATAEAVERARNGGGPTLIECKLDRFFGHFEGDNQNYRAPNEVKEVRENKDCIKRFAKTLMSEYAVKDTDLGAIDDEVQAIIDGAVAKAVAAADPGAEDLLTDVYIKY